MTDSSSQTAPTPQSVTCTGVPRQRDPKVFSGADDEDVEDWFASYERVSAHNKWDDPAKLTHVIFYLAGVAQLWFHNHESDVPTWSVFKTTFTEVFGRPAVRKLRAEQRLRARAQQTAETFTSYIEDVVDLCKRVNAAMPEAERIRHILKGIDDGAFQMLLARNPRTVSEVVSLCQSYDELRKQRASTRRPLGSDDLLASLDNMYDPSSFFQRVKDFVREEVARQLSLVPFTQEPTSRLPNTLRTLISEEVAHVVPSAPHQPPAAVNLNSTRAVQPVATPLTYAQPVLPVAAPLTYAQAVRRPPPASFTTQSQPLPPEAHATSWTAPRANPWRTPDNRPICYSCCTPGHVARYCRRRPQAFGDASRPFQYGSQPFRQYAAPSPQPYARADIPEFPSRRSPSPRRRSLSPMRRRPAPPDQEN